MRKDLFWISVLSLISVSVWSNSMQDARHSSLYAGYQVREIKSLSESDLDAIREGRGWGLALPAELNGLPGPVHLLELKDQLNLSVEQVSRIRVIYDNMHQEAVTAGARFIQAERILNKAFKDENLDSERLASLVNDAAQARAQLRYVHLSRHLMTPSILTPEQIKHYAVLRGYGSDPCTSIPEGHDEQMWRKHNNCQ